MLEQFSQGTSLLHRRDIRIKLISALALIPVIALSSSIWIAVASLATGLTLVITGKLAIRNVVHRLLVVNSFVAFLWFTLPLTYPGEYLQLGLLPISKQGLFLAIVITGKANAIYLLLITLLATSTIADLGYGMERLKVPGKLCLLLLFSYRYIFVINQEYQRLARSAQLRCFEPRTNLHTYRTFGHLFGMTLLKSWHRAERVHQAMVLRGFNGQFHSINHGAINGGDLVFCSGMVTLALTLVAGELLCRF